jgi:hypothetical protein
MKDKKIITVNGERVVVNTKTPEGFRDIAIATLQDPYATTVQGSDVQPSAGPTDTYKGHEFKTFDYNGKTYLVDKNGDVYPATYDEKHKRYIVRHATGNVNRDKNIDPNKHASGGYIKHFGPGGDVNGPGTATSDSIPAYLSNGEYVINASAVNKYGTELFDGLNAKRFHKGGAAGHKHLSSEHASSQYKAPKSLMQKIWDNILFPTALWADRLQSGLSGTQPIANTNLVQEALWDKQAREQGISSVIKPMAAQTVSDIAGLAVPGRAVSAAARMGLEGYGATRGIYGLGNLIPQKGATSYALSSASKFGAAAIETSKPFSDIIKPQNASMRIIRNIDEEAVRIAKKNGKIEPTISNNTDLTYAKNLLQGGSDYSDAVLKYWTDAFNILIKENNSVVKGMSLEEFIKEISKSTPGWAQRYSEGDLPSKLLQEANKAYLKAHGLSPAQELALYRATSDLINKKAGYWSISGKVASSYLRNIGVKPNKGNPGGLLKTTLNAEKFSSPIGIGGMYDEYATVLPPSLIKDAKVAGYGWMDHTKGPNRLSKQNEWDNISKRVLASIYPLEKYHSGGVVQGRYGQEVLAMLQGGEVILPKEIGRRTNYHTSSSILDSVTKNLNSSFNVTINVPNTNASPQEIAQVVMRTIKYEQGRAYTSGRVV